MLHKLRTWDTRTAHGPDLMLANSSYVRARIRRIYGRDAQVVHPPVAIGELEYVADKDDYYVSASFLAPYKRTDLVIQAFSEMPSRRLVVVGEGQQSKSLRALAGPNVTFAGYLPRAEYVKTVAAARAMVFAGCEDFGIALAEAQASGTPLIALRPRRCARYRAAPWRRSPADRRALRSADRGSGQGRGRDIRGQSRSDLAARLLRQCRTVLRQAVRSGNSGSPRGRAGHARYPLGAVTREGAVQSAPARHSVEYRP